MRSMVLPTNEDALRSLIHDYFLGMYRRDVDLLRSVFHHTTRLRGHLEGGFVDIPLEEWLMRVSNRPIPEANGEKFEMAVVALEVKGLVATAIVRDLYRGLQFTDYLQFAKIEGEWRIVSKLFHHD